MTKIIIANVMHWLLFRVCTCAFDISTCEFRSLPVFAGIRGAPRAAKRPASDRHSPELPSLHRAAAPRGEGAPSSTGEPGGGARGVARWVAERFPTTRDRNFAANHSQQLTQLFQETSEPPIVIWVMETAQNGSLPQEDRAVCCKTLW